MIKKLLSFVIMVSAVCLLSSCLKDNDDEMTYYDDTAVTAFTLGTLTQQHHTTAKDGITDSVYTTTYNAQSFAFYIDQTKRLIYNTDSLPYGTDASKILTSITTKNGGTVILNLKDKSGSDSLAYYNTKDTLDFTQPMRLRVYNMRNIAFREYTVSVNIHQQTGDEMTWSNCNVAGLADVADRKMIENNGTMYLFGVKEGKTIGFKQNGDSYTQLSTSFGIKAYQNVVAMKGCLYILDGNSIMRSADGISWTEMKSPTNLTQLIGASSNKLYALTTNGIVSSADDGATWDGNVLDDDAANLPTGNICFVCTPIETNAETNSLLIIGTHDGQTKIWRKVEENAAGSQDQPWAFYPPDQYNKHPLPILANLQVISYDNVLLALGGDFSTFYSSKDQGLTWFATNSYELPSDLSQHETPFAMTCDSNHMIYITRANETIIRSGRIARLGWDENQTIFTE
jgi:hypothetical protein